MDSHLSAVTRLPYIFLKNTMFFLIKKASRHMIQVFYRCKIVYITSCHRQLFHQLLYNYEGRLISVEKMKPTATSKQSPSDSYYRYCENRWRIYNLYNNTYYRNYIILQKHFLSHSYNISAIYIHVHYMGNHLGGA